MDITVTWTRTQTMEWSGDTSELPEAYAPPKDMESDDALAYVFDRLSEPGTSQEAWEAWTAFEKESNVENENVDVELVEER